MLDRLRSLLFPASCAGCRRPGWALCATCAPTERDAIVFSVGGIEAIALAAYAGPTRDAILAMKHGERDPLTAFAHLLEPANVCGVLVPVPTTRARAAQRGFDQTVQIAKRVSEIHGLPWADALEKRGRPQAGLGRKARLTATGRFRIRQNAFVPKVVTLFDDVCTTGATLADAVFTLTQAGADVRRILVLARKTAEPTAPGEGR